MVARNHSAHQRNRSRGRSSSRPSERTKRSASKQHRGRSRNDGRRREHSDEAEARIPSRDTRPRSDDRSGERVELRQKKERTERNGRTERTDRRSKRADRRSKTRSKSRNRISADRRDDELPALGRRELLKRHQRAKDEASNDAHRERKDFSRDDDRPPLGKREILRRHSTKGRSASRSNHEDTPDSVPKKERACSRSKKNTPRNYSPDERPRSASPYKSEPQEPAKSHSRKNVGGKPTMKWFSWNKKASAENEQPQHMDTSNTDEREPSDNVESNKEEPESRHREDNERDQCRIEGMAEKHPSEEIAKEKEGGRRRGFLSRMTHPFGRKPQLSQSDRAQKKATEIIPFNSDEYVKTVIEGSPLVAKTRVWKKIDTAQIPSPPEPAYNQPSQDIAMDEPVAHSSQFENSLDALYRSANIIDDWPLGWVTDMISTSFIGNADAGPEAAGGSEAAPISDQIHQKRYKSILKPSSPVATGGRDDDDSTVQSMASWKYLFWSPPGQQQVFDPGIDRSPSTFTDFDEGESVSSGHTESFTASPRQQISQPQEEKLVHSNGAADSAGLSGDNGDFSLTESATGDTNNTNLEGSTGDENMGYHRSYLGVMDDDIDDDIDESYVFR
jgi:hypothetical protein